MDYLRLILLIGSISCAATWLARRRRPLPEDSLWRSRLVSELIAGRGVSSALLAESGKDTKQELHRACRGLPFEAPEGADSGSLLLKAALEARGASLKKTEEAVSKVRAVLQTFEEDEARLQEMASAAAFRSLILSAVLCFLTPFLVEMLPLLGAIQGAGFTISSGGPLTMYMGVSLALVSSHFMSSAASQADRGQDWGRMAAFMAILFISTSAASLLPLVGSI